MESRPQPSRCAARIVLVEDEPAVRRALVLYLSLDGHEVLAYGSLAELEQSLGVWPRAPDLLITDWHLGGSGMGTDVIDRLAAHFGAEPTAIVLTGDTSGTPASIARRRRVRLLSKPVSGRELSAVIRELLGTLTETT